MKLKIAFVHFIIFILPVYLFSNNEIDKQSIKEIDSLNNFMKLWDFSKLENTEKQFSNLLPMAKKHLEYGYYVEILTQVARTQGLQSKFTLAHQTLDKAQELFPKTSNKAKVRYYLERGRVFNSSKNTEKATPLFEKAWKLAKTINENSLAVDAAHMLAISTESYDVDKSLEWSETAIKFIEQSKDKQTKGWLAMLYNNTAWTYHDLKKDYIKAMMLFKKALKWHTKSGDPHRIHIAKWSIGRCLRSQGKYQEALNLQLERQKELKEKGKLSGYVYEELAENHFALNNKKESTKYFSLAYTELTKDKWFVKNNKERIKRLKELKK